MTISNNIVKITEERKKTVLPFVVHRAPLQNHLAYEKKGHWTEKEKLKYVIFLSYFKEKFTSRDKKKRFCRIFKVMSDFIKTRTHNQCRSHHQKMEKERFQVDSIIKNVVSKYHPRVYQELYERYLVEIENLNLEEHEQYKIRKINQNEPKYSSESNIEPLKNQEQKQLKQRSRTKQQIKRSERLKETLKSKLEEAPIIVQKPFLKKRELRMTQQCSDEEEELLMVDQNHKFQFPPSKGFFSEKHKSLDFSAYNNFIGVSAQEEKINERSFPDYLQALEFRKIQSLDKATYHYNQMQIELANVAECEKERSAILQRQNQRATFENASHFNYANFFWGFQDFRKPF